MISKRTNHILKQVYKKMREKEEDLIKLHIHKQINLKMMTNLKTCFQEFSI